MGELRFKADLKRWLKLIEDENPYPKDIFLEPLEGDWKRAGKVLEENGISSDRVFAKFGRMVWGNCINSMKDNSEIFENL